MCFQTRNQAILRESQEAGRVRKKRGLRLVNKVIEQTTEMYDGDWTGMLAKATMQDESRKCGVLW